MTGSMLNIIFVTIAFTLLVFALTFIIVSAVGANKISAEKRISELKTIDDDGEDFALVKHESKKTKRIKDAKKKSTSSFFEKLGSMLYKELQSADIKMRPEEFLIFWILIAMLPGSLVSLFSGKILISFILIGIGSVLPIILINVKKKQRIKKFDEQLGDALMICCSSLRSGLSFNQAMEAIAKDMDAPISSEFEITLKEINMGYSMEEALDNLGKRINSKHLALMVSAVLVQRQTGGNLSQILENISDTIKDRMKLRKQLKTATSSGKMSGMIVGAMPVILLGMFTLINYDFVAVLYQEVRGNICLAVAAGLELMAFVAIKKITTVKM